MGADEKPFVGNIRCQDLIGLITNYEMGNTIY